MKTALFLILIIFTTSYLKAQSTTSKQAIIVSPLTNTERYGIDYQLKNYTFINGDSTILTLINLESIEYLREQNQEVEVIDSINGVTIILFFEKKNINRDPSPTLNEKL